MTWELIVSAVVFGFIAAYVYKFTMDWLERTYPDRSPPENETSTPA